MKWKHRTASSAAPDFIIIHDFFGNSLSRKIPHAGTSNLRTTATQLRRLSRSDKLVLPFCAGEIKYRAIIFLRTFYWRLGRTRDCIHMNFEFMQELCLDPVADVTRIKLHCRGSGSSAIPELIFGFVGQFRKARQKYKTRKCPLNKSIGTTGHETYNFHLSVLSKLISLFCAIWNVLVVTS